MNYLETFVKSKLLNNKNWIFPPQLSKKNVQVLKSVYTQLLLNKNGWKSCIRSTKNIGNVKDFLNDHSVKMLEDESMKFAKDAVEQQLKYGIMYTLQFDEREVCVYLIFPKYVGEEMVEKRYLWKIVVWLKMATQYAKSNCAKHLDVYLFLTNLKKTLPTSQLLLNRIHVNTAFTTPCTGETDIMLYRYEEWFKVLIHETFHCLGLDFSNMDNAKSNRGILDLFQHCDPKTDIRLSETYCEVWAEVLNVLFYENGRKYTKSPKYIGNGKMKSRKLEKMKPIAKSKTYKKINREVNEWSKIETRVLKQLMMEQAFSLYQSVKVLEFNGLKYPELCDGHPHIPKYMEETQVLSYFVIKGILLFYLDEFMNWCAKYNTNQFQFTQTPEVVQKYVELVENKYLEKGLLKNMDWISKGFFENSQKNDSHMDTRVRDTMRMTVTNNDV